jgi:hypothetical protein
MLALLSGPMRVVPMNSAISLTLIVCLMTSALPLTAQAQMQTPGAFDLRGPATPAAAGPLVNAMKREAVRLAAAGEPTGGEAVPQGGKPAGSDWSRVRTLTPGTEVIVTVKGSPPAQLYYVAGDESDLTVLNVADPTLPRAAREVLRDVASKHPEYFPTAQQGRRFVLEKNVRMGPEGVFLADQKVADLGQVVETTRRNDVAEIKGPLPYSPRHDALVGLGTGAAVGGGILLVLCSGFAGCSVDDAPFMLRYAALMGGIFAGISVAAGATKHAIHKTEGVIYRAP